MQQSVADDELELLFLTLAGSRLQINILVGMNFVAFSSTTIV